MLRQQFFVYISAVAVARLAKCLHARAFFQPIKLPIGNFCFDIARSSVSQNFAKSAKDWRLKTQKNTGLVGTVFCMEVSSKSAKNDRFTTSFIFGIHG